MISTLITSKEIPPDLLERYPNLRSYLSTLNKKSHADMAYLQTLSRDLRTLKQFNIVYPVGEPIFIHIMSRGRERPLYSVVSPM